MTELEDWLHQALAQQGYSDPPGREQADDALLDALQEYRDAVSLTQLEDFNVSPKEQAVDGFADAWEHLRGANEMHLSHWDREFIDENIAFNSPPWMMACSAPEGGCGRVMDGSCEFGCWWEQLSELDDAERERYARFLDERWERAAADKDAPSPWKHNALGHGTRIVVEARPAEVLLDGTTKAHPALTATVYEYGRHKPPVFKWACGGEFSEEVWPSQFEAMRAIEERYDLTQDMPEGYGRTDAEAG